MKRILSILGSIILAAAVSIALVKGAALLGVNETGDWHARTLGGVLAQTALFSAFGIMIAIFGYKLFDLCTPGNLHEEIVKNKNIAAAIVGGAVILGVSIIVAVSMLG